MTEAQRAALRILMRTPPERVHTHRQQTNAAGWGYKRSQSEIDLLGAQLKEMEVQGCTRKQMKLAHGVTGATIIKLLGKK